MEDKLMDPSLLRFSNRFRLEVERRFRKGHLHLQREVRLEAEVGREVPATVRGGA